tara:strand:- start:1943 stop:3430 length:1488 start_codon:yes stop_codon:yes gene_type:complete
MATDPTPFFGSIDTEAKLPDSSTPVGETHLEARSEDFGTHEFSQKKYLSSSKRRIPTSDDLIVAGGAGLGAGIAGKAIGRKLYAEGAERMGKSGKILGRMDEKIRSTRVREAKLTKAEKPLRQKLDTLKEKANPNLKGAEKAKQTRTINRAESAYKKAMAETDRTRRMVGNPRARVPERKTGIYQGVQYRVLDKIDKRAVKVGRGAAIAAGLLAGGSVLKNRIMERQKRDNVDLSAIDELTELNALAIRASRAKTRKPFGRIVGLSPKGRAAVAAGGVGILATPAIGLSGSRQEGYKAVKAHQEKTSSYFGRENRAAGKALRRDTRAVRGALAGVTGGGMVGGAIGGPVGTVIGSNIGMRIGTEVGLRNDSRRKRLEYSAGEEALTELASVKALFKKVKRSEKSAKKSDKLLHRAKDKVVKKHKQSKRKAIAAGAGAYAKNMVKGKGSKGSMNRDKMRQGKKPMTKRRKAAAIGGAAAVGGTAAAAGYVTGKDRK